MRRLAAFTFTELAEGSATLARLGEARSERARRAYLAAVSSAVAAAGGREVATVGDGTLASFDSASAALAYALAVQRGCDREARRSRERLDVRVGIDVGEVPGEDPDDSAAVEAAGRAQRLARAADAGAVLATSIVAAVTTATEVRFRPAGLVDVEGAGERIPAVEVLWERRPAAPIPLPPELESRGPRPPFVGRSGERERLEAAWQQALAGERQLAFVVGEPGIGKTRLVAEFARSVHAQGSAVLWGRSSEEALTPYQPFVQALVHYVRCASPADLREQVGAGAGVLARLLPDLRTRISVPEAPAVDPDGERYRLFDAVARLLATVSADRPLLVVLDDLQWADQGTLLLIKHLAGSAEPAPLLVLGTYRQGEVGREHPLAQLEADIERDRILERIELSGLADEDVARLVGSLIGSEPSPEVVRGLRGETEGNPFFVEELVRHLGRRALSAEREQFTRVRTAVHELGVPARVGELVSRRVQRLPAATQVALRSAAVIGAEFAIDVLAGTVERSGPGGLVADLDAAVEARLLVESPERVGSYRFSHALVQEALYEELTVNHRAALHERVAATLEALHTDDRVQHAELAYHYARAGDRHAAKVVRHGRSAAEDALRLFAYEAAVRAVTAALTACPSLECQDASERAELLALLGTAQTRAGDYPAARAAFHEAAELSLAVGAWPLLAHAVLGYGAGAGFGGVWVTFAGVDEELVRLLELALAACPPGDSHERVRLLGRLAQALYWAPDDERALALSEEAVASARRLGDPAALAYALDSRHVVLWRPEHLDQGRAIADEMLELGRRLGDRDIQLEALAWLITDALEREPIAVVDGFIAEHARIATELRQPYHLWYTEATRAMRAHLEGRFAEAAELCERAYAYGRDSHGENALQTYLVQTMFVKLDLGQLDDLIDHLRAYVAESPLVTWRAALAVALAGLDRREEALEQVAWFAERGFGSIRSDCVWTTAMVVLGRTVAHFDDPTHAQQLYDLMLPLAERNCVVGGAVLCLGPISRILGMLARAAGRPAVALDHFRDALERSRALGSPPLIARTQLETAKAHLLLPARDEAAAAALLEEAAAIASELGMTKLLHDIDGLRSSLRATVSA